VIHSFGSDVIQEMRLWLHEWVTTVITGYHNEQQILRNGCIEEERKWLTRVSKISNTKLFFREIVLKRDVRTNFAFIRFMVKRKYHLSGKQLKLNAIHRWNLLVSVFKALIVKTKTKNSLIINIAIDNNKKHFTNSRWALRRVYWE
jgi:hypothetical protein